MFSNKTRQGSRLRPRATNETKRIRQNPQTKTAAPYKTMDGGQNFPGSNFPRLYAATTHRKPRRNSDANESTEQAGAHLNQTWGARCSRPFPSSSSPAPPLRHRILGPPACSLLQFLARSLLSLSDENTRPESGERDRHGDRGERGRKEMSKWKGRNCSAPRLFRQRVFEGYSCPQGFPGFTLVPSSRIRLPFGCLFYSQCVQRSKGRIDHSVLDVLF